jgi:SAM-dependent methyltransferase
MFAGHCQHLSRRLKRRYLRMLYPSHVGSVWCKLRHPLKDRFVCPLCTYHGPFRDGMPLAGGRIVDSDCPYCGSNVRMRMQFLVMNYLACKMDLSSLTIYHFSPEVLSGEYYKEMFGDYLTAGLTEKPVDCPADLTNLPFPDLSCDFIFASHILEHIQDDARALSEIARVLKPNGIAVLPVPIVQEKTVEYGGPNPYETDHVRAPGLDYFDKYKAVFSKVEVFSSEDFDPKFQLLKFEDRTVYPTKNSPMKRSMPGNWHLDYVPVCYKSG